MVDIKYQNLKERLKSLGSLAIAFSGGIDSYFLLYAAKEALGENVLAITVNGSMYLEKEVVESKKLARVLGVKHIIIDADEFEIEGFVNNESNRCYYCKKAIFTKIKEVSKENGILFVADGTNADDINDYRPGLKALKELNIMSPLQEEGIAKKEIRELSRKLNISIWNKPSMACLASRIPYGVKINAENLKMVEKCEMYLYDYGYRGFRVRYHGDLARIEMNPNDIQKFISSTNNSELIAYFKEVGFTYVTLDLEGYKVGSMNHVLDKSEKSD